MEGAETINLNPLNKPKGDLEAVTTSESPDQVETTNSPNSDSGDENDDEGDTSDDDVDDYCYGNDDDYMYDDNNDDDDDEEEVEDDSDYLKLQAQLDRMDLTPGVEASISLPISSLKRYKEFKAFDVVDDFPDHHFKKKISFCSPTKEWTKRIQDEWRILEKDLPETIFARACESRMDLMRAAITGPQGTPYHDGLFMFDIHFPPSYPQVPPLVNYHSGGLRINPNLYDCGKVCLSLLNTWTGHGCEKWQPGKSTMLQVLVSIQALILNEKPYFNEPGYEHRFTGPKGEQNCIEYSENILFLSLKTMVYTINRPPKHFEDLVVAHFRLFAHDILAACKAYLASAPIGSVVKGEFPIDKRIMKLRSKISFNIELAKQMNTTLIPIFSKCGAKGCDKFFIPM